MQPQAPEMVDSRGRLSDHHDRNPHPTPIEVDTGDRCVDRNDEESEPSSNRGRHDSSPQEETHGTMHNSRLPRSQDCGSSRLGGSNRSDEGDEDGGGDDGDRGGGAGNAVPCPTDTLLACPFYRYNGMKYMSCSKFQLRRIRDVKQHINRRHRRPLYCLVCGLTFETSGLWGAHISARTCDPVDRVEVEGIDEAQMNALARRVNRSLDKEKQWLSIWAILFPDSTPPS
jgi:hypothetical protein